MVGIVAGTGRSLHIVGHGLTVSQEFVLAPGVLVTPQTPTIEDSFGTSGPRELRTMASIMAMESLATFSLFIEDEKGGRNLAVKGWNALWLFNLLALACHSPIFSLYSIAQSGPKRFSLANRNLVINPLAQTVAAGAVELEWARAHYNSFDRLIKEKKFQYARDATATLTTCSTTNRR